MRGQISVQNDSHVSTERGADHIVIWGVAGLLAVVALASIVLPAFVGGAWSPTPMDMVHRMLERAQLRSGEVLYDLGAGDGRMVMVAAQRGALCYAVEVDPLKSCLIGWRVRWRRMSERVHIVRENFFHVDLSTADVVTAYLSPAAMAKLAPKFEAELTPGSRVVSYRRAIPGWTPQSDADDIYVYHMPQGQPDEGESLWQTK